MGRLVRNEARRDGVSRMNSTELARQLIETRNQRKEAEERFQSLKDLERRLVQDLLAQWEREERTKDSIDGHTLYVLRDIQFNVREDDKEAAIEALRRNKLGWLVNDSYHYQSAKAAFKSLESEAEAGDSDAQTRLNDLKGSFNIVEQYNIGVRAASKTSDAARRFTAVKQ